MELETENSRRNNGEGEDVEMESTNNAPIEIGGNDNEESLSPCPQFKKFMGFEKANGNTYSFECKLGIPINGIILLGINCRLILNFFF